MPICQLTILPLYVLNIEAVCATDVGVHSMKDRIKNVYELDGFVEIRQRMRSRARQTLCRIFCSRQRQEIGPTLRL